MKFKVNANCLLNELNPVIPVATKNVLREFSNANKIEINVTDTSLKFIAFGGLVSITKTIENDSEDSYEFIEEGKVTIDALSLIDALGSFGISRNVVFSISNVDVENNTGLLRIELDTDSEQYQSISVFMDEIKLPSQIDDLKYNFKINRKLLIQAMKNISFAVGFEKDFKEFFYWRITTDKDQVRFLSGTNGRFAINTFCGSNIIESDSKVNVLLHKDTIKILSECLSFIEDETIEFTVFESKTTRQTSIKCKDYDIVIVDYDSEINLDYVNEEKILNTNPEARLTVSKIDLDSAIKGINAASDKNSLVSVDVNIDTVKKILSTKIDSQLKSNRKVQIQDLESQVDNIDFSCCAPYISEISKSYPKDSEFLQINYLGNLKPIIVFAYADKTIRSNNDLFNDKNIKEQFVVFFAPLVD